MAYKLKLKECLEPATRRVATEQLDKALSAPSSGADRVAWVHETRKSLKRIRALLRLVRSGMEHETWRRENNDIRAIGRLLSPLRDRDVLRHTLGLATEVHDDKLLTARDWLVRLLDEPRDAGGPPVDPDAVVSEAMHRLTAARDRMAELEVNGSLTEVVGAGLARTQRKGRKALTAASDDPTDENIHELRKSVQTAWRQWALLSAAWPEAIDTRVALARELSQALGEAQDLAVLAAFATAQGADDRAGRRHGARIVAACRKRQEGLRAVALPAARRLFALPPKAVAEELADCWCGAIALAEGAN